MSIPAAKGFEIGLGFSSADMTGSEYTDPLISSSGHITLSSNHCGGSLGGITVGAPSRGVSPSNLHLLYKFPVLQSQKQENLRTMQLQKKDAMTHALPYAQFP